jgi:hypothetical protein
MFRRKQVQGNMKNKLPSATLPLPGFRTDREAAEYFDTHSIADIWDQLPRARPAKLSADLAKSIRKRQKGIQREAKRLGSVTRNR